MAKRPAKKAVKPAAKHGKSKAQPQPKKKPVAASKPVPSAKSSSAKKSSPSKAAAMPPRVMRQTPPPPPPPPLATPKPPAADAVLIFERGMAELQRHNYSAAKTAFQGLLDKFPSEGFLTDRPAKGTRVLDR